MALHGSARSSDIEEFYRGRSLRIIVGYAAGGGFDVYARLLAEFLPRHLPGRPSAQLQYMPGAATEIAAAYIVNVAPQDGTIIGIPLGNLPASNFIFHKPGEGVDVRKFNWIGRLDATDGVALAWGATGVTSIYQLQNRPFAFGATSPTGSSFTLPMALNRTLGTKIKLVTGYNGTTDEYLALQRGEIEGMGNGIWTQIKRTKKDWLSAHLVTVLYQHADVAAPDLPGVPRIGDLASNEDDRRAFRLLSSESTFGRSFYVGPNVPPERIAALRQAFSEMAKDPALWAAADQMETTLSPMAGEDLQNVVDEFASYPPTIFARARELSAP
jgi:tripartite-type tricarboxylate transporter receptor subunit TctC